VITDGHEIGGARLSPWNGTNAENIITVAGEAALMPEPQEFDVTLCHMTWVQNFETIGDRKPPKLRGLIAVRHSIPDQIRTHFFCHFQPEFRSFPIYQPSTRMMRRISIND
jgi:hypothetical protein